LKRPVPVQRRDKRRQALVDLPGTREIFMCFRPGSIRAIISRIDLFLDDVLRSLSKAEDREEKEPVVEERFAALVDEASNLVFVRAFLPRLGSTKDVDAIRRCTNSLKKTISSEIGRR
jgi:hypothetical protein